jgi:hypothetical protein
MSQDSPLLEIYLGSYNNTGNLVDTTETNDLVIDDLDHVERIPRSDRVNKNIAMDADRVLCVQNGILVLV